MTPLFPKSRTAAKLLDMREGEFLALVSSGALPPAKRIGEYERWDMAEIQAIIEGKARLPEEDIE